MIIPKTFNFLQVGDIRMKTNGIRSENLDLNDANRLFSIVRSNMSSLCNQTGGIWAWDDVEKRIELMDAGNTWLDFRCETTNETIAVVVLSYPAGGDDLFVQELQVAPKHQGRGIGGGILVLVEQVAKGLARKKVRLVCLALNTRALAFYQRAGFQETAGFRHPACLELEKPICHPAMQSPTASI